MSWPDDAVVEARLRRLDAEACASFVAALWDARGFETTRRDGAVIARRGSERCVVLPLGGRSPVSRSAVGDGLVPADVDVVVAPASPRGSEALTTDLDARLVDAGDLAEMLRYAVDRQTAATLCSAYLGAAPDDLRLPLPNRIRRAGERVGVGATVVAVAALVLVVGAGAVLGPGLAGVTGGEGDPDATPTPSADGGTVGASNASAPTGSGVTDPATVPGLAADGIADVDRLASAHAAALGNESYTIWFDYFTPEEGAPDRRVQYDTDALVDGERSLAATSLERHSDDRERVGAVYFDGTRRYVADGTNGTWTFRAVGTERPTATPRAVPFTRPAETVRTYLATPESTVERRTGDAASDLYRVSGEGRPSALPSTVADYSMVALVDEQGLVREFEATFTVLNDSDGDGEGSRERVRLTWTYDRIGATAIPPDPAADAVFDAPA
jgi:hypothetical protein